VGETNVAKYPLSSTALAAVLTLTPLASAVAATTSKPANAVQCAVQNATCVIPAGRSATVWYGSRSSYVTRVNVTGSLACTDTSFGTSAFSFFRKTCSYVLNPAPASDPTVDAGTTTTTWASTTATPKPPVAPGTWRAAGANIAGFKLVKESAHFAFYSDEAISDADLNLAADTLENTVWQNLFNSNLLMPEPYSNKADKIKPAIHIHSNYGLSGGAWVDAQGLQHLGMWIGPGALRDHWGLTHEFTHGWQNWAGFNGGLACTQSNTCGWTFESHANFTRVPEQCALLGDAAQCAAPLPWLYP
jgi:hypothetical protein